MESINVKHIQYRTLTDTIGKLWDKISFWTKAEDVEMNSGDNLEEMKATIDTNIVNSGFNDIASDLTGATLYVNTLNEFVRSNYIGANRIINNYSYSKCDSTFESVMDYYDESTGVSCVPLEYGLIYNDKTYNSTDKGMVFGEGDWVQTAIESTQAFVLKRDYKVIYVIMYNSSSAPKIAYQTNNLGLTTGLPTPTARSSSDRFTIYCRDNCKAGDAIVMSNVAVWKMYGIAENYYPFGAEMPTNINTILDDISETASEE